MGRFGGARLGSGCAVLLCLTVGGVFSAIGFFLLREERRTGKFLPVKGVVTFSAVKASRGDGGTTYAPDVLFEYEVEGRKYTTGRYRINQILSSGRKGKEEIVRRHPVGAVVQAWFDPQDPSVAVIDRSLSVLSIVFSLVGLGLLIVPLIVFLTRRIAGGRAGPARSGAALESDLAARAAGLCLIAGGRRETNLLLRPRAGSGGPASLGAMIFFTLLVNAMSLGSLAGLLLGGKDAPWWAWCIVLILSAAGLLLLVKTVMLAMARLALRPPEAMASAQPLRLGETFEVRFHQRAKKPVEVERVKARLVCRESATYRQGTDTRTVTHEAFSEEAELVRGLKAGPLRPIEGRATFKIPEEAMHTFDSDRNSILWSLEIHTALRDWPDYPAAFVVEVAPERAPAKG